MCAGYCPACAPGEIECPLVQNFFPDGMEDSALAALARAQKGPGIFVLPARRLGRSLLVACDPTSNCVLRWASQAWCLPAGSALAACSTARVGTGRQCVQPSIAASSRQRAGGELGWNGFCNFPTCTAPTSCKLCSLGVLQRSCRDRYHKTPVLSFEASSHYAKTSQGAACCAIDEKTCVVVDYTPDGNFTGRCCWRA